MTEYLKCVFKYFEWQCDNALAYVYVYTINYPRWSIVMHILVIKSNSLVQHTHISLIFENVLCSLSQCL